MWHERMERYGNPHEHIDLPVSANVYVAPPWREAENDIMGLEAKINEEFHRIGNPADKDGNFPKTTSTGYTATGTGRHLPSAPGRRYTPLVGTPEVVCERLEILRSKGINRIFGKFGAAGLDLDKSLRCIEMFATQVMPEFAETLIAAD